MAGIADGPSTTLFAPLKLSIKKGLRRVPAEALSEEMAAVAGRAPSGSCVSWGIPFEIGRMALLKGEAVSVAFEPVKAAWLVFLHTSDARPQEDDEHGFPIGKSGVGRLGEHAADYVILYADGAEERVPIRRRHQIGAFQRRWGENCFEAVAHRKPRPVRPHHEQTTEGWGFSQTRATAADWDHWVNWLWAWPNPQPRKSIVGVRLEPVSGTVVLSAISTGKATSHPLRWETRRKAVVRLPKGEDLNPTLDGLGLLSQIRLDMGQVISASNRLIYPNEEWASTYNNRLPGVSEREVLVEYTAHPEARFHLSGGKTVAVRALESARAAGPARPVAAASQRVTIRVIEKGTGKAVSAKLHVHGEAGEYLAPVDRHRIPNRAWFEDYSVDFAHDGRHYCTYIPGKALVDLPIGNVYLEVSKGFEIRPVRKASRSRRVPVRS